MKHFVRAALAWLSADPIARFAPKSTPGLVLRANSASPEALTPDTTDGTSSAAAPAGARARPAVVKANPDNVKAAQISAAPPTGTASAIYFMSNADNGDNYVYAYALGKNGQINTTVAPTRQATGGKGRVFTYTGDTVQDALDSQGSLRSGGARLFAVNAGSNTVTQFGINCSNPLQLIPLGDSKALSSAPVAVNGNFPSAIGVGPASHRFCVATTGQNAGIQCYTYSAGFGPGSIGAPQAKSNTNVKINLPAPQTGNVPTGPPDTVSQVLFTDDENYVIVIVKGAADSSGKITKAGFITVYPIGNTGFGTPVTSSPTNTALLFGCTLQYNTYNLFCADSGIGGLFLQADSNFKYTVNNIVRTTQLGGGTPCWTQRSVFQGGPNYLSAVDKNYIASFDSSNGNIIQSNNFAVPGALGSLNPQLIELQTAANFIYGLSFGNQSTTQHIFVAQDAQNNGQLKPVQQVTLKGFTTAVEGLALFNAGDSLNNCDFQ